MSKTNWILFRAKQHSTVLELSLQKLPNLSTATDNWMKKHTPSNNAFVPSERTLGASFKNLCTCIASGERITYISDQHGFGTND